MKKQTTLFLGNNLSAAPADHDFVVDGLYAGLALSFFNFTGTSLQVTATALVEDGFDLTYKTQTTNFTVGRRVRGELSNAEGTIVNDVDGGATGTLTLKRVNGNFIPDEPLYEVGNIDPSTRGEAVVNAVMTRRFIEDGIWADTGAVAGVDTVVPFINPDLAAGDGDRSRVWPRRFRLKFTATVTDADIAVDLVQSEVK